MTAEPAAAPRRLARSLTLVPATAVILANIIGTGVFMKARVMTCNVGTPEMVMLVWVVAGVLTLAGALIYAELSAMMPRSGGAVNFLAAAYGPRWAFLYGWTSTISLGASIAAGAIVFVVFLNDVTGGRLPDAAIRWLPVVALAVVVSINLATMRSSGRVVTALTAIKIALVLGVGVGAFVFADGDWGNWGESGALGACDGVPDAAKLGFGGFGAAMLAALWGYDGSSIIASIGGEVRDPGRTLPRALIGGVLVVIVLYLFVNAAYFYVLSPVEVASVPESSSVAREVAGRFLGSGAAAVMSAGLMVSAYGTLHSTMMTGPRIPYSLARARMLPSALGYVSNRSVPAVAIVALGAWAAVLTQTGSYDVLTDAYVFLVWVFMLMTGLALFLLRRTQPDAERPYRVWGYPFMPILFLIATTALLLNTLATTPWRAASGLALVAIGLPVYAYHARRGGGAGIDWLAPERSVE